MEDRLCIERVVHGCLVPVTLNVDERMDRLFHVYTSLDEMATILFDNMLQLRAKINKDFCELLTAIKDEEMEDRDKVIHRLNIMIARALPDPVKTQDHLKKLSVLFSDNNLYKLFQDSTDLKQECPKIIKCVSDIVKKLSAKHVIIDTVKALLDRACPMLVDKTSFIHLLKKIQQYFEGFGDDSDEEEEITEAEIMEKGKKALKLVQVLAKVRPVVFQTKQAYEILLLFLKQKDKDIVEQTLHCLKYVLSGVEEVDKSLCACFKPVLNKLVVTGSCKQSKYAMRCLYAMMKDSTVFLERLFSTLVDNLTDDETCYHIQTTMSALGEMAILAPSIFDTKHKEVIRDFVVKKVLVVDREKPSKAKEPDDEWGPENAVSDEIHMKVQAIKLLVKWLSGLENNQHDNAMPVLRLLCSILNNDGDLCGEKNVSAVNRSRLRLAASSALLKLAQQVNYIDAIALEQYHQIALVMQDSCFEVRELFTVKLHKGLETLRLPPDFMAIYALAAVDPSKERRNKVKQMIVKNSQTRRDYCKQHSSIASKPYAVLPEYSLPYLVHILAHHPDFDLQSNESLLEFKEYLWYFLEPLLGTKAENYSFLKKLLENIKRTKDKLDPDNVTTNEKLYAVCDLAIACIMQKTHTFTLKDFPGNLVLPKKLFVAEKNASNNTKSYLPKNFVFSPKKHKNLAEPKTDHAAGKRSGKRMKRSTKEEDEFDSDDDIPLAATPAKKARTSVDASKNSSSKKSTASSATKNKTATKVISSPVKAARKNLSSSPAKKSPAKGSRASPRKRGAVVSKENKSPNKSKQQSPKKKAAVSPKKRVVPTRGKQTKIDSFVNGRVASSSEAEDDENEEEEEDEKSDVDMMSEEGEEDSESFTAINDEKPPKKSPTPSPIKKGSPTKTTKGRNVVQDEKPTPKLKIRRKPRSRR